MEEKKLHQTAMLDESPRYREVKAGGYVQSIKTVFTLFIGAGISLIVLIGFITGMIGAWKEYIATWGWVWQVLIWVLGGGVPMAVGALLIAYGVRAFFWMQREREDILSARDGRSRLNAEMTRQNLLADAEYAVKMSEAAERQARAQQIALTLPVDEQGNALYRDPYTGIVTPYIMQMREHPGLTSYHHSQKNDNALQAGQQQAALPAAANKPTVEEMAGLIEFNSLDVALGRSLATSENLISSIEESHLKIIGGSRMGKSCGAGGILRQVELTHDPRKLSFALLDLEYKTSRLFENSNHLITMGGNRDRAMHAKTIEEVPQYLRFLTQELERRDRMTLDQVAQRPHVLIYLEEFLNLKRQLQNNFEKKLYQQFLTDFNTIATRGLKLGLHLMVCAQVDYADKDLRDSIAQFMGLNMAYGVKPEAARAAGFVNHELLQQNYANRQRGQFVIESFSGADIGAAPDFDVKAKIKELESSKRAEVREEKPYEISEKSTLRNQPETGRNGARNGDRNEPDAGLQAHLHKMMLATMNYTHENPDATTTDILKNVWDAKPGNNADYYQAKTEYAEVQRMINALAMRGMNQGE
jgi:hypothetical protein